MSKKGILVAAMAVLLCVPAVRADEGMWLINGLNKALEKKMKQRGLKLSAREIYNADAPGATLSDAVVSLDFCCTGSFISEEGLLITNHHCAYEDLHALSWEENNMLEDGFWAKTRGEEMPIPGKKAYLLKRVIDITDEVARLQEEQLRKTGSRYSSRKLAFLLERKYGGNAGEEVALSPLWMGEKYCMMCYQVYTDVRLVAAPPVSVAAFGGDIDNWEWPQHKCDFALYRVYVSPSGAPADPAEENVPLKPAKWLEISTSGYRPGDFAMVMGYPGNTNRYCPAAEMAFEEQVKLPISNRLRGRQMEIIRAHMNADSRIRLIYADRFFNLSNMQEFYSGKEKNIRRFDLISERRAEEEDLQRWIEADPQRKARWGRVIPLLNDKYRAVEDIERNIVLYREALVLGTYLSRIVSRVNALRMEVYKELGIRRRSLFFDKDGPDSAEVRCCRDFRFCGRNYPGVCWRIFVEYGEMDLSVEKSLFQYSAIEFLRNFDRRLLGPFHKELLAQYTDTSGRCDYLALTESLWNGSFFTKPDLMKRFFSEPHSLNEYYADPLCRFFSDVRIFTLNCISSDLEGEPTLISLKREYTHAKYEKALADGTQPYPNANSTLRLTYGTVGGLNPSDAVSCACRSTTDGLFEKYDPSVYEYGLKADFRRLLRTGDWGRWGDRNFGKSLKMNVNFLTDNDIAGGNSGSPVLDAQGRLIGLAFDGNKESLASDVRFVEDYTKCVCVDIRYVLWTLEKYAGMDRIMEELGFPVPPAASVPSVPPGSPDPSESSFLSGSSVLPDSLVLHGSPVLPDSLVLHGSPVLPDSLVLSGSPVLPGSLVLHGSPVLSCSPDSSGLPAFLTPSGK